MNANPAGTVPRRDRRRPVAHPELRVDLQQVGIDRGLAEEQSSHGLAVGGAARDQLQHLPARGRSIPRPPVPAPAPSAARPPRARAPPPPVRGTDGGWSSTTSTRITSSPAPEGRHPCQQCGAPARRAQQSAERQTPGTVLRGRGERRDVGVGDGNCVEVGELPDGGRTVRDMKDRTVRC